MAEVLAGIQSTNSQGDRTLNMIETMVKQDENRSYSNNVIVVEPVCDILADQTARSEKAHRCFGSGENLTHLKDILPVSFDYVICEFNRYEPFDDQEERFDVLLRVAATTEEEAVRWLEEFQLSSKITWRVDKTYPDSQKKLIFKKVFHCQHNTRASSHKERSNVKGCHKKNTNCPSILTITIRKFSKISRAKDPHGSEYAMIVALRQTHNHLVNDSHALQHRPVSADVRLKFTRLFEEGLRPPKALLIHRQDLKRELLHEHLYRLAIADRALCPDIQWCYRLYYKLKGKTRRRDSDKAVTTERLDALESSLRDCVEGLCARIRKSPQTLVPGVEQFLATLRNVDDDAILAGLFSSFSVPNVKVDNEVRKEVLNVSYQDGDTKNAVNGSYQTSFSLNNDEKHALGKRSRPKKTTATEEHAYSSNLPTVMLPLCTSNNLSSTPNNIQNSRPAPVTFYSKLSCPTTSTSSGIVLTDIPVDLWTAAYVSNNEGQFVISDDMQYSLCEDDATGQRALQNMDYRTVDVNALVYSVVANNG